MNASFSRTDALQAVRWAKSYEARGFTVDIEVRGSRIFAHAHKGMKKEQSI